MNENKDSKINVEETKKTEEVKEVVKPEVVQPVEGQPVEENINPNAEEEFKEDPEDSKRVPIVPLIIIGAIVILMIVCVIVILTTGGPYDGPASN